MKRYNKVVAINLINHKGSEMKLGQEYEGFMKDLDSKRAKYEYFDFHHECKGMKYERIYTVLCQRLEEDRKSHGYFSVKNDGTIVNLQDGVFRNNCMDCLDRTKYVNTFCDTIFTRIKAFCSVVQSSLAKLTIDEQLIKLGILKEDETVFDTKHSEFSSRFKNGSLVLFLTHLNYFI